jgi:hypothetical protein
MNTDETQTNKANGGAPPNPFADIEALRRAQDYSDFTNPEPTTSFSVRTLQEGMHLRVNPDAMYTLLGVYTPETKNGVYFVWPQFRDALGPLPRRCNLHVAVNGHGEYFLLRVKLSNPGQDDNRWYSTARMVTAEAMQVWVKVTKPQNTDGGWGYIPIQHQMFEPQWPTKPLQEVLTCAFPDRVIDRLNHELIEDYIKRGR